MKKPKTEGIEYVTTFMRKSKYPSRCKECKTPINEGEECVQETQRMEPALWIGCIVAFYCHKCGKKYDKSNRVLLP